ncbi:hypothetical protein D3C86_1895730 [compost metagenome]
MVPCSLRNCAADCSARAAPPPSQRSDTCSCSVGKAYSAMLAGTVSALAPDTLATAFTMGESGVQDALFLR